MRKLVASGAGGSAVPWAVPVVQRAAELFAGDLVGVAVFGSWARRTAADQSDIDLLVVVERSVPLTRRLYRRWDEAPLASGGHRIEPQFVHLLDPDETGAGLWAEAALDGIVLFERDLRLSATLVRVRRNIVSGRIERRTAHGQPYWVENEVA